MSEEKVVIDRSTLMELLQDLSKEGSAATQEWLEAWIDRNNNPLDSVTNMQAELRANSERWFPSAYKDQEKAMQTNLLGIVGEAGEMADNWKKHIRGSITEEEMLKLNAVESVDVMHYLFQYWDYMNIDWLGIYLTKTEFNEARFGPKDDN